MKIIQKGNAAGFGKLSGSWTHLVFWPRRGRDDEYDMVYVQAEDLRGAASLAVGMMDKRAPQAFISERVGIIGPQALSSLVAYVQPSGQVFQVKEQEPVYT